jgi:O-acetyl-ADP-ribose deacetylase (regulator of RNase III)
MRTRSGDPGRSARHAAGSVEWQEEERMSDPTTRPGAARTVAELGWIRMTVGDLFDAATDAVVVSANNWLKPGSGAARAAVDRGGPAVAAELRALRQRLAPLRRASVVTLPGGALQDAAGHRRHLIHVVTTWYDCAPDGSQERVPATPRDVFEATTAALREAARLGARSVALTPMCARPGYSAVPPGDALRLMGQAVLTAAHELRVELADSLERVELMVPDAVTCALLGPLTTA